MKKSNIYSIVVLIVIALFSVTNNYAQVDTTTPIALSTPPQNPVVSIHEDARIKKALKIKSKMNFNDRYKIQLYYGNLSGANNIIGKYRRDFSEWPSSIEYETPNHKVWVGNFRNRLEADRALVTVQKKFPNAFVFKPDRS